MHKGDVPAYSRFAMKSGAFRRAIRLTLLYIGLFIALVLLQFSRGPGLSERFGNLSVSATYQKDKRDATERIPDSVRLEYAGFSIEVSRRRPALLASTGGRERSLLPRAIDTLPDGVRITLEGEVELRATVGSDGRFGLTATALAGGTSLKLRYSTIGRARLSSDKGAFRLESGGSSFDLAFASSTLDAAASSLVMKAGVSPGSSSRFAIAPRPASSATPAQSSAMSALVVQEPKDPAAVAAQIALWRDKTWAGLSASRYDAERIAWRGRIDGQGESAVALFSEKALAAYLAESLARGGYTEALARMRGAKDRYGAELSYLSAPYLGGIAAKMEALAAADQAEAKRLAQLVVDKAPEIFAKEGLVRFLFDRAPAQLAQDVLAFAATIDPAKLTMRHAAGVLACIVESRSYLGEEGDSFDTLSPVADRIRAAARKTPEGLFLATEEDGSTDARLSLLTGLRLAEYGSTEGRPELLGIGQGLVEGYLGIADELGIAPSRLAVRDGAIAERSGTLLPEDTYPIIASNHYYPRQISFYRTLGHGVWAWTCSSSLSVEKGDTMRTFSTIFPEGRSHYMAFMGIGPFVKIQLYNIDYNADSEFEIYDAPGYLYRKATLVLYVKMKYKHPSEAIKLYY